MNKENKNNNQLSTKFDWLKNIPKRAGDLYFSLCESQGNTILKSKFKEYLNDSGLVPNDYRLKKLFEMLEEIGETINFEEFINLMSLGGLLIERALRGELAVPDFKKFSNNLDIIYDEVINNRSGELASYIPPLAEVNPEQFGIAVVTADGQVYQRGDTQVDFSIQSMCKPFNYCIAIEDLGLEKVNEHVGAEPSGRLFNDLTLMMSDRVSGDISSDSKIPFNPMVNPGAIMTTSLIKSKSSTTERLNYVREQIGKSIGWDSEGISDVDIPRFNKNMARQENFKGYNNIAAGFLLMATGNIPYSDSTLPKDKLADDKYDYDFYFEPAVTDALKVYFSICSLEMTAKDVAVAAATLANGGVCPLTQQRVFSQKTIRDVLPVVQTSGMYNSSGQFFQEIGLPSKSGVGGGVLLIVPQVMGICIFSPRLDLAGNSVRGIEVARKITSKYLVHIFDSTMTDIDRVDPRLKIAKWRANNCGEAIWAASYGDVRTLEKLLGQQRDLKYGNYDIRTPLHLASAEGQLDVVKFLLKNGVKPIPDRWGGYPISDARNNNHQEIVDEFLKLDIDYSEPFHLIEEPNGKTDKIEKYDDELAIIEFLFAASENDVDGLRQLVAKGIPINVGDKDSRTSLHLAAAEGSLDAVIYLINHGHLLSVRDRWGATPLDEAIRENRDDVIEYIKKLSN